MSSSSTNNSTNDNSSSGGKQSGHKVPRPSPNGGWLIASSYIGMWIILAVVLRWAYLTYRKSQGQKSKSWFGKHAEKEAYEELLKKEPENEEALRKALIRRAMTDVRRIRALNEEKESVHNLMKAGAISETMWNDFKQAENEIQLEIFDLHAEAETFKEDWSQRILQDAAILVRREDELVEMKRAREREEKRKRDEEKKLARQKEHEERTAKEQEERARKMREKFLAEEGIVIDSKKTN